MTFYVGQKVVCVDADSSPPDARYPNRWGPGEEVVTGQIYTVRRVFMRGGDQVLWLDEVARNAASRKFWGPDAGYFAWRFRPVTDISDLQQIVAEVLKGKPRKIKDDQFDKHKIVRGLEEALDHAKRSRP